MSFKSFHLLKSLFEQGFSFCFVVLVESLLEYCIIYNFDFWVNYCLSVLYLILLPDSKLAAVGRRPNFLSAAGLRQWNDNYPALEKCLPYFSNPDIEENR
jgi:hypothetical protein